ncbi:isochorismate synthase [Thaumasiovibrio subtropicus]|uniref:isochorismate synthase n=1 Tax=Thaumasiovibrio subtropicus TaxID=1891207 RepID=UPI000B35CD54|nr:isochorismate synthase [Thaumasiovibrio subtropicus]
MSALHSAVEALTETIATVPFSAPIRLETPLDWPANVDLIDWLDAQAVFPKFYWQHRDGREEIVALGQVSTFTDPAVAEETLTDGQRIWGGLSFDGRTAANRRCMPSFFFLPQIELVRQDGFWRLAVNVSGEKEKLIDLLNDLRLELTNVPLPDSDIVSVHYSPDQNDWTRMVNQALADIEDTALEKVVLARRTTLQMANVVTPAQLLKASCAVNPRSYHFMMALSPKHSFVGSTPERLMLRRDDQVLTEALAGTIGRGKDANDDAKLSSWLLNDEKNRYENQLVVNDIEARLSPLSQSIETALKPELVKLRQVQHLKRPIKACVPHDMRHAEMLQCLQPTAAVAGLPREMAYQYILENEPFARGWYSGSVGYLGNHQSEFCVALRSALMVGNEIHLFAGAGIVPGSVADMEWQELERKTATLKSLLENNSPLPHQQTA